ncbi:hypothetical protein COO91_05757 [Nostoc flagelliforme CCNUN1]|uniref:Uncharacterized protein n=1 Tax=Nostoc flagelliforme CCNUN1 TaxID=2038116 RepID=A0A2K8SWC3_9NOSO|nr:hypothetical protein COO91_05757 [Nostoc flagelliforme CCNUN1]
MIIRHWTLGIGHWAIVLSLVKYWALGIISPMAKDKGLNGTKKRENR